MSSDEYIVASQAGGGSVLLLKWVSCALRGQPLDISMPPTFMERQHQSKQDCDRFGCDNINQTVWQKDNLMTKPP